MLAIGKYSKTHDRPPEQKTYILTSYSNKIFSFSVRSSHFKITHVLPRSRSVSLAHWGSTLTGSTEANRIDKTQNWHA